MLGRKAKKANQKGLMYKFIEALSNLPYQTKPLPHRYVLKCIMKMKEDNKTKEVLSDRVDREKVNRKIRNINNIQKGKRGGRIFKTFFHQRTSTKISNGDKRRVR